MRGIEGKGENREGEEGNDWGGREGEDKLERGGKGERW